MPQKRYGGNKHSSRPLCMPARQGRAPVREVYINSKGLKRSGAIREVRDAGPAKPISMAAQPGQPLFLRRCTFIDALNSAVQNGSGLRSLSRGQDLRQTRCSWQPLPARTRPPIKNPLDTIVADACSWHVAKRRRRQPTIAGNPPADAVPRVCGFPGVYSEALVGLRSGKVRWNRPVASCPKLCSDPLSEVGRAL